VSSGFRSHLWQQGSTGLEEVILGDTSGRPIEADAVALDGVRLRLLAGFHFFECRVGDRIAEEILKPIKAHQFLYPDGLVGLSPRGRWCFIHWDDYTVIDLDTGARCFEHPIVRGARVAALSEDGPRLAVGTSDGRLFVLAPDERLVIEKRVSDGPIEQLAIAHRGDQVLYVDERGASDLVAV
jgi:hypothetical protein